MKASRYIHSLLILLTLLLSASLQAQETGDQDPDPTPRRKWLVTSHAQLSTNGYKNERNAIERIGLSDGDPVKNAYIEPGELEIGGNVLHPWHSVDNAEEHVYNYIDIRLNEPLKLAEDESLVFYTKRHTMSGKEHPLSFEVMISNDGVNYEDYARIYFMYRGGRELVDKEVGPDDRAINGTKEYSARVSFDDAEEKLGGEVNYIRLVVLTNNTKTIAEGSTTMRTARLACLNVMQIPADENYSDILIDRFHLVTDYSYKYYNYEFVPTLGIFEPRNRYQKVGSAEYNSQLKDYAVFPDKGADSPWVWKDDADNGSGYYWNKDLEFLNLAGVSVTSYTQQTNKQDSRIAKDSKIPNTNTENWRQPTHETEHILYAIPGDPIALYPFYDIAHFKEKSSLPIRFVHWYNYRTGGTSPYLDFLIDPALVCKSKDYGYYVGPEISLFTKIDPETTEAGAGSGSDPEDTEMEIASVEDYIAFVKKVNDDEKHSYKGILTTDLDFDGRTDIQPVGNNVMFKGIFDGQGHTIRNLKITSTGNNPCGMFGFVSDGAIVKNLIIDKTCSFKGELNIGFIAAVNTKTDDNKIDESLKTVTVSNIVCMADIYTDNTDDHKGSNLGGIVGQAYNLTILNCSFTGNVWQNKYEWDGGIGALVGHVYRPIKIESCLVNAEKVYYKEYDENWQLKEDPVTPDPYLFNKSSNSGETISNVFSNQIGSNESAGVLQLYARETEDDPEFYIQRSDLPNANSTWPEKIDINSQIFAEILGSDEWLFDESEGLLPFVKTYEEQNPSPVIPDDPIDDTNLDEVRNLKDLLKKIYGPTTGDYTSQQPSITTGQGVYKIDKTDKTYPKGFYNRPASYSSDFYKVGTAATFFCPRVTDKNDSQLDLPKDESSSDMYDKDYLIVADISSMFVDDTNCNVTDDNKKLYEPSVLFRHIFRIKDGRQFAEDFSDTKEKNDEYVRRTRRVITASVNCRGQYGANEFQIRLDHPAPLAKDNCFAPPSELYYKITDSDYRRVRSFKIETFKIGKDGSEIPLNTDDSGNAEFEAMFELPNTTHGTILSLSYNGEGKRKYEDTDYFNCGGGGYYSRMLFCQWSDKEKVKNNNYLVRLIACDINGDPIKIHDTEYKLIVQEYAINFIDTEFRVLEDVFKKDDDGKFAWDPERFYGDPVAEVTFNEYADLTQDASGITGVKNTSDYFMHASDSGDDQENVFYKWPVEWKTATYGFGPTIHMGNGGKESYKNILDYNYNVYAIANHYSQVPWHKQNDNEHHYDVSYYKQENEDNQNSKKGFFFWINSSADPCVAATLNLGEICAGSMIHVSAWMMEFSSGTEVANMSFNFIAVTDRGREIKLHTFNSGYVKDKHKWYNIQYDFLPDVSSLAYMLEDGESVDHYSIELENNCKNSEEADYAIDEIQVFVTAPEVKAEMLDVICDSKVAETKVKITLPFQQFLTSLNMKEVDTNGKAQNINAFYTFLDKNIFDRYLKKTDYLTAYDKALLRYDYDPDLKNDDGTPNKNQTFGCLNFSNYFVADPEEEIAKAEIGKVYHELKDGVQNIVIFVEPENEKYFSPGQTYYVGMIMDDTNSITNPGPEDFDIAYHCSHKGIFTVTGANKVTIKPENESTYDLPDGEYCLGSSPYIEIDINAIAPNATSETDKLSKLDVTKASLDWYAGSLLEYNEEKMDGDNGTLLSEVLVYFREIKANKEISTADIKDAVVEGNFTEEMKNYLIDLTKRRHKDGRPMLRLNSLGYDFKPGKLIATTSNPVNYVTAIPFLKEELDEKVYKFCDAPIEVTMKVSTVAPDMYHGLDIDYPEEILDVPIRIGMKQIEMAKDNNNTLRVPILRVSTPSKLASKLLCKKIGEQEEGEPVYLLETTDPYYMAMTLDNMDDEKLDDADLFLSVGHITKLEARKTQDARIPDNAFYVKFDDVVKADGTKEPFTFHEGYSYTMKFDIWEANDANVVTDNVCPGQHIFTIKVVPEYLLWVGKNNPGEESPYDGNLNWNNDANWQRLNKNTIKPGLEYTEPDDYINLDYHTNEYAYAPLDFTKVVIGDSRDFPRLYEIIDSDVDGTDSPDHKWSHLPDNLPASDDAEDLASSLNEPANGAGAPTPFIHYDMVAYDKDVKYTDVAVACRPWYANTAKEINFRPNSEILGQQYLRYEKAWVEMEMKPNGWYTAASPLQGVVAGDMYLPTKGARQEDQFFSKIEFALERNDRFRPAVYQRSWNLASDKIYQFENDEIRNGFVKLNWSNVYNDVQVAYNSGEGFSIRTDVSEAEKVDNKAIDKVLFRFPKEDKEYTYYNYDKLTDGRKQSVESLRDSVGRLNPTHGTVTIAANESSLFFLVGNPFMAHLDIRKFLEKNSDKVESNYWILNSTEQKSVVLSEGIAVSNTGEVNASTLLPPLAGFMVKATAETDELTLNYDEDMMQVVDAVADAPGWLKAPATRSAAPDGMMLITASTAAGRPTTALLSDGSSLLDANADLVVDPELNVPATVYTVADGRAMSINAAADMHCTELGVVGSADDDITLRFEGPLCDDGYYLNDRRRGCSTPLRQGLEYKVKGQTLGALYISDQPLSDVRAGLSITAVGGEVVVTSGSGSPLNVRFCNTAGVVLKEVRDSDEPVRYRPEKGVLIVEAADGADTLTKTLIF